MRSENPTKLKCNAYRNTWVEIFCLSSDSDIFLMIKTSFSIGYKVKIQKNSIWGTYFFLQRSPSSGKCGRDRGPCCPVKKMEFCHHAQTACWSWKWEWRIFSFQFKDSTLSEVVWLCPDCILAEKFCHSKGEYCHTKIRCFKVSCT